MSKMSNISLDIQTCLEQGLDCKIIASKLNIPLDWVLAEEANIILDQPFDIHEYDNYHESMW